MFGASSQTDPVRGIGAATAWVTGQMQAIAATSSGRMTVQQQTFVQPVSSNIPVPTTITNVIATLQLARFVTDVAPFDLTGINIRVIWRRDRYLRGSDHVSFQQQGYPAARLTEPRENFNHEHQDVRVENGVQFGDLPQFVDFDYTARVARVNGAALWALATNPSTPKNLQIHTAPPPGLPGTNLTALSRDANPEPDLAGYEVVMRETTAANWTSAISVGNVTSVTLNISKDNVQFGLRAVDRAGHRSPAAFPAVAN